MKTTSLLTPPAPIPAVTVTLAHIMSAADAMADSEEGQEALRALIPFAVAFRKLDGANRTRALRLVHALPNWAGSVPDEISKALDAHPYPL